MRIRTNEKFYERKSQISEPRSKQFIIFEGIKTEQIYFEAYLEKYDYVNDVFFFLRDKEKEGWSNPSKIMNLLIEVINGNEKISFTFDTIFENFYDYISSYVTTITKKKIKAKYIDEVKKHGYDLHSPVDIDKLNEILKELIEDYIDKYEITEIFYNESILKELLEERSTFDKTIDQIYLIVDRDKKSFTDKQYTETLNKAIENGIKFYVINPCFEFWLLLHFKDCLEYAKERLFNNDYVNSNNTFVYEELKKCDVRYTKNNFNANNYIEKIGTAINNAKKHENNIELLKDNVGTNLPSLFCELEHNKSNIK